MSKITNNNIRNLGGIPSEQKNRVDVISVVEGNSGTLKFKTNKLKIAHIVNPVKVKPDNPSYLFLAQPVTFKSMLTAKNMASHKVDVELYTAQYEEDRSIIPHGFTITPDLTKSIHDFTNFKNKAKKLPRIIDIINRLYHYSDADYFVFSNSDIGVKPDFYTKIKNQIDQGVDGGCIHRRDLPKSLPKPGVLNVNNIERIYKVKGAAHPGHDCFFFKRDIVLKMRMGNVFVGYPPIGMVFRNEVRRLSTNFKEYHSNTDLTFHLGSDRSWKKGTETNDEYHNKNGFFAKTRFIV